MLDPGKGKTKTGRLWTVVRDERPFGATTPPAAFYRYSPDRKAEHARTLLAGCRGSLHADGYAGFADLYKPEPETGVPRLTEVACGWTAKQIHEAVLTTFHLADADYGLSQMRYDLRRPKGHGLIERDGARYAYRLTCRLRLQRSCSWEPAPRLQQAFCA